MPGELVYGVLLFVRADQVSYELLVARGAFSFLAERFDAWALRVCEEKAPGHPAER